MKSSERNLPFDNLYRIMYKPLVFYFVPLVRWWLVVGKDRQTYTWHTPNTLTLVHVHWGLISHTTHIQIFYTLCGTMFGHILHWTLHSTTLQSIKFVSVINNVHSWWQNCIHLKTLVKYVPPVRLCCAVCVMKVKVAQII